MTYRILKFVTLVLSFNTQLAIAESSEKDINFQGSSIPELNSVSFNVTSQPVLNDKINFDELNWISPGFRGDNYFIKLGDFEILEMKNKKITIDGDIYPAFTHSAFGNNQLIQTSEYEFKKANITDLAKVMCDSPKLNSKDIFKDKIVLIGATFLTSQDLHLTPYFSFNNKINKTPGVEIQASIIHTILNKKLINNSDIFWNVIILILINLVIILSFVFTLKRLTIFLIHLILFIIYYLFALYSFYYLSTVYLLLIPLINIFGNYLLITVIKQIIEIYIKNKELKELNENLERKVEERTNELQIAYKEMEVRNKIIEEDLLIARKIQRDLLPTKNPIIPNLKFYSLYEPMDKVGGDFFDFIQIDDEHLGIFISDVSGHGVPAAFITSMVKALITTISNPANCANFVDYINKKLITQIDEHFLTAFYSVINFKNLEFNYTCAGHPPTILIRNKELIKLGEGQNMMLGVFDGIGYKDEKIKLKNGDKIIFYTDGIIEAFDKNQIAFKDKFYKILDNNDQKSVKEIINIIYKELKQHEAETQDDICVIGLEIENA